jgi:hypothetical protein
MQSIPDCSIQVIIVVVLWDEDVFTMRAGSRFRESFIRTKIATVEAFFVLKIFLFLNEPFGSRRKCVQNFDNSLTRKHFRTSIVGCTIETIHGRRNKNGEQCIKDLSGS